MNNPDVADLASTRLFADLSAPDLAVVAQWFEVDEVSPGQRLALEGNSGYALCVLHAGTAEVTANGQVLRELGAGDYFGEISLLGDGKQTATITVTSPATVWTMFGTRFRELQQQHPELAATVARTATERLHSTP